MCSHLIQNLGFVAGCKEKMIWSIYIRTKIPQKCALDGELGRTSALYLNICPIHSNQLITTEGLLLWPTDCDASSQYQHNFPRCKFAQQLCGSQHTDKATLRWMYSCVYRWWPHQARWPCPRTAAASVGGGEMLPAEGCTLWPPYIWTRGQEE